MSDTAANKPDETAAMQPAPPSSATCGPLRRYFLVGRGIVGALALFDMAAHRIGYIAYPLDRRWGELIYSLLFGAVLGQIAVLTVFGALGPGPAWRRQTTVHLVWLIWAVSFLLGHWLDGLEKSALIADAGALLCFPAVLFAMQAPLWVIRAIARFRLIRSDVTTPLRPPQTTIGEMFFVMGYVGGVMATAQYGVELLILVESWRNPSQVWANLGFCSGVGAVIALVAFAPAAVMALRARSWRSGAVGSTTYFFLGWWVFVSVMRFPSHSRDFGQVVAIALVFPLVFSFVFLIPLVAVRWAGYRLYWGWSRAVPQ